MLDKDKMLDKSKLVCDKYDYPSISFDGMNWTGITGIKSFIQFFYRKYELVILIKEK